MARDKSLSPTGSGGDQAEGLQTSTTGAQSRPEISLKRGRAESVEPAQPSEPPASTTTAIKKNRLAPSTGKEPAGPMDPETSPNLDHKARPGAVVEDPKSIAEETDADVDTDTGVIGGTDPKGETQNVGEVREKVEKMTYDEAQAAAEKDSEGSGAAPVGSIMEKAKSDSEDGKDGLKRKTLDRSQSSYVEHEGETKRQKDEIEATTEMKPLDPAQADKPASSTETAAPASSAPAKKPQSTFASFSSSASPFATSSTSAFGSSTASSSTTSKTPNAFAKSGFGGFSSAASPFAKAKSTSASEKKEEAKSDDAGPSTFGDILSRDQGADEDSSASKLQMTEQDVHTGEEDEETVYQTRSKLYVMEQDGGWRERGVGMFKVNVRRSDGRGARLVMRAEGVLRLILNVSLFVGQTVLEDGKHVRMTVFEDGQRRSVTFRTGSAKVAHEMYEAIHDHIPVESSVPPKTPDPDSALSEGKEDKKED